MRSIALGEGGDREETSEGRWQTDISRAGCGKGKRGKVGDRNTTSRVTKQGQ